MKKICLVATTIGNGDFLDGYYKQAVREGVLGCLKVIVIPDYKSPRTLYSKCKELFSCGLDIVCPTIEDQENYLKLFNLCNFIPHNSDNRRNIGFLMAFESRCDTLISVDDDNFCAENALNTFLDYSLVSQNSTENSTLYSDNGWFNICEMLDFESRNMVYPRGFPYNKRHGQSRISIKKEIVKIRLNAGLWQNDPDVDAITWLATPVKAKSFKGESIVLSQNTWSPVNTQNTSLNRDLIPAYYFIRMGHNVNGFVMDRYGDIFSGYFCQACMRLFEHRVRVGTPIALHNRNSHNYLKDLSQELYCILVLEDVLEWLREVKLEGRSYVDAYFSLADAISYQIDKFKGSIWINSIKAFFYEMVSYMRTWASICQKIEGKV